MDELTRAAAPRKLVPRRDRADTLATLHMWTQIVGKMRMARMPALNHEAHSHEVSSTGWWPSSPELGPTFYSYMYPQPEAFPRSQVTPDRARFDPDLGLFVLREADLEEMGEPEVVVQGFLQSTYAAGADLAGWDGEGLEATRSPTELAERLPWPPVRRLSLTSPADARRGEPPVRMSGGTYDR